VRFLTAVVAGVGVLTMLGGSGFAGSSAPSSMVMAPRTLAVVTGASPEVFGATASGAAWIDGVLSCKERIRRVHVLSFGRSRPNTLRLRLCSKYGYGQYEQISFDHGRAVWIESTSGNTFYEGRVFIAGPGDRAATTLERFGFDRGRSVEPSVLVAGDAAGSVIGNAGPVLRVVGRRARLLFGGAHLSAVDVSGNHIGVVRPEVPADVESRVAPQVEVHVRRTGALLSTFEPSRAGSIAVSAETVAIWPIDESRVDSYDLRGRKLASRRLVGFDFPGSAADAIGIVGRRIVYPRGRGIHAWDPRTGADKLLGVTRRQMLHFVVTGHRAIWTERVDSRRFAIRAMDIPIS
jgi:hypothetical protein